MLHIDPQKDQRPGFDYGELRKEGLKLIEKYSGSIWTDYNRHDPGITILEQLVFALTELSYKTDFEVKDIFTNHRTGKIDEHEQVLLSADEIMTCSSLTQKDYTRILYDSVKGVANAWLEPVTYEPTEAGSINGLYKALVFVHDINEYHTEKEQKRIENDVRKCLAGSRNLCEDFEEIILLEYADFYINADIEITSIKTPEEVLAEIYHRVSQHVAPEIRFYSYPELLEKGKTIDEIFTGPPLVHGFMDEDELGNRPNSVYAIQVIDIINSIEGVKSIKNLTLSVSEKESEKQIKIEKNKILRFTFQRTSDKDKSRIRFYKGKNTRKLSLNIKKTGQLLDNLNASQRRMYRLDDQYQTYLDVPAGEKVKFDNYFSIQNQFPHIYGINHFGIPSSESYLRKAQAKQLKAYLMVFEQVLVNFLSQLHHTKDLFSIRENHDNTYYHSLLNKNSIPHIRGLYTSDYGALNDDDIPEELGFKLDNILGKYDEKDKRKNRFLDYLLSLYGERFHQYSLSRLNYYYSEQENEKKIINNKINFLSNIQSINKCRGVGYNYHKAYAEKGNISGVEQKVKMLLEINGTWGSFDGCSILSVFDAKGLKLVGAGNAVKHDCYKFDNDGTVTSAPVNDATVEYFFEGVGLDEGVEFDEGEKESVLNSISFIRQGVIDEEILRAAIDISNYKIGRAGPKSFVIVLLTSETEKNEWKRIGTYSDFNETKKAVYATIDFVKELNIESEDFHIIEHVLLRPRSEREPVFHQEGVHDLPSLMEALKEDETDFYSFRISVVLPKWTARFNDSRFQALATETFHLNIPAHISIDYVWLEPEEMCDFEQYYCEWLSKRTNSDSDQDDIDTLSAKIEYFLKAYKVKQHASV